MKALFCETPLRRIGALLLAALLAVCQLGAVPAALAEQPLPALTFTLTWGDQQRASLPVTAAGYENSFWLYLPAEVFYDENVRVTVTDSYGQYVPVALENGQVIPPEGLPLSEFHFLDAGDQLGFNFINVISYDAQDQEPSRYSLYMSTTSEAPAVIPETPVIEAAFVTVVCLDQATGQELSSDAAMQAPGPFTVAAPVIAGYDLVSDAQASGVVDESGANPARVEFWYVRQAQPAEVVIVCLDQATGQELSSSAATQAPGPFTIDAPQLPGYDLVSAAQASGLVDANGANPARVEFWYVRQAQPAEVAVVCLDRDSGAVLSSESRVFAPGPFTVDAPQLPGYDLDSDAQVSGLVDANGANPPQAAFYYRQHIESAAVTVICVDETNAPFDSYVRQCAPGVSTVEAEPRDGYDLDYNYPGQVFVNVTAQGADVPEITFHYVRRVSDVPVPVYYRDLQGVDLLAPVQQMCHAGDNEIAAPVLEGYVPDMQTRHVTVTAEGANPDQVIFVYAPLATETPTPTQTPTPTETAAPTPTPTPTDPPAPAIAETSVPVYYVDNLGNLLAQAEASVIQGENYIQFNPDRVSSAYVLQGEQTVRVTVDASGVCAPDSVTFLFIAPVDVTVRYLDFESRQVAEPQTVRCMAGVNPIDSNPQGLPEGYILADDGRKYVTVDENGADAQEIVFLYAPAVQTPTDTPEPSLALVPVYYRTTTGSEPFYVDNTVKCFTGTNTVEANADFVPEGYRPEGPTSVTVTVDENGAASPASVEFVYNVSDMTRSVMVYYRGENGQDLAAPQSVAVGVGDRRVAADPALIPEGWQIAGESEYSVRLDEDGTLTPDYLVFTLRQIPATEAPTTQPSPTVAPLDYPMYDMDAYCYPKNDGTALRSFPADDDANLIGRANQGELTHVDGYVVNSLNETWYIVTVGDQTGYMRDSQVRLLTQEDLNALFGTPVPATPSPVPETPIPDGAIIDRWASLTADSVNFRAEASKQSKTQGKYNRNQKIFIYDSITMNGEKWYRANIGGRDGYMMARYIDLMSGADSAAYQATLATPMPVRTEAPTDAPATQAPTDAPATPTLAPTDAPTPSPAPYTGYALTARSVDLRTGITVSDTTLSTLPAGALLYLYGQAYVNGVCWNSAEEMAGHVSGFVPDDALRRVSAEEAMPYLAAMRQTDTPTPPTVKPDPYTGYAVTNGGNVMLRNYADEKAEIAAVLDQNEVLWVMSQEYVTGSPYYWEVVQYGKLYGYVRSDQVRMMEPAERAAYEQSLRTLAPAVEYTVTVPPVSQGSMSSYGYVTTNNVRLRSGAGTANTQIRMMSQYAFALVLGSETVNGQLWYHINQAGTEGYVMADYFKVLSLGELSEFLTSDAYRQSAANAASGSADSAANPTGSITSVEDFNSGVWKNPALTNVTYEPFSNIIASPTPDVELSASTPAPSPSLEPTATAEPSDSPVPLATASLNELATPEPNAKTSGGSGWIWVGIAAAVLAGGGAYGYSIYRANQRRAAQRAAQRRQQQQQQARAGGYARPTQQVPAQPQRPQYQQGSQRPPQQTSVFAPPRTQNAPGSQTPANPYQPQNAEGASQPAAQSAQTPQRHRRSEKHQS